MTEIEKTLCETLGLLVKVDLPAANRMRLRVRAACEQAEKMHAALAQAFEALPNGPARMAVAEALLLAEPAETWTVGADGAIAVVAECRA